MTLIKVKGKETNPDCPLYKRTFLKLTNLGRVFFVCIPCMISINVNDPSVHLWADYKPEVEKDIECINNKCGESMNFFFRADGFMKAFCPKCKSTLATENLPPRIDKPKYTAPAGDPTRRPYYDDEKTGK